MGGSCSATAEMRNALNFMLEGLERQDHSRNLGVDVGTAFKWIVGKQDYCCNCIHLAHNRGRCWALENRNGP
jgi:hypothetical protein